MTEEKSVYVIISEYPQEGGAKIEGVYKDLKIAEHIFDLLEGHNTGRKFIMEEQEIR